MTGPTPIASTPQSAGPTPQHGRSPQNRPIDVAGVPAAPLALQRATSMCVLCRHGDHVYANCPKFTGNELVVVTDLDDNIYVATMDDPAADTMANLMQLVSDATGLQPTAFTYWLNGTTFVADRPELKLADARCFPGAYMLARAVNHAPAAVGTTCRSCPATSAACDRAATNDDMVALHDYRAALPTDRVDAALAAFDQPPPSRHEQAPSVPRRTFPASSPPPASTGASGVLPPDNVPGPELPTRWADGSTNLQSVDLDSYEREFRNARAAARDSDAPRRTTAWVSTRATGLTPSARPMAKPHNATTTTTPDRASTTRHRRDEREPTGTPQERWVEPTGPAAKRTVYINRIHVDVERQTIWDLVRVHGCVLRIRLRAQSHDTANTYTYGHVEYRTPSEAQQCVASLNGQTVGKFPLEVSLARTAISGDLVTDAHEGPSGELRPCRMRLRGTVAAPTSHARPYTPPDQPTEVPQPATEPARTQHSAPSTPALPTDRKRSDASMVASARAHVSHDLELDRIHANLVAQRNAVLASSTASGRERFEATRLVAKFRARRYTENPTDGNFAQAEEAARAVVTLVRRVSEAMAASRRPVHPSQAAEMRTCRNEAVALLVALLVHNRRAGDAIGEAYQLLLDPTTVDAPPSPAELNALVAIVLFIEEVDGDVARSFFEKIHHRAAAARESCGTLYDGAALRSDSLRKALVSKVSDIVQAFLEGQACVSAFIAVSC